MEPPSSAFGDDEPSLSPPQIEPTPASMSPVEKLQRRYSDQLSQEIEQLENDKAQLQTEVAALTEAYAELEARVRSLQQSAEEAIDSNQSRTGALPEEKARAGAGPRLPGEPMAIAPTEPKFTEPAKSAELIELPIPATSEQRRQRIQRRMEIDALRVSPRRGIILAAIAALLMALQFCIISTLSQGGSWLGFTIGQLGTGFMPAVALLWLRMLVTVPALMLLAPQLHTETWEEIQDWIYSRNQLLALLIASGVALFFSQVLVYQCIGLLGSAVGVALLFLYPLAAVPLGLITGRAQGLSSLGGLALVAIAMGGVLLIKPILNVSDVSDGVTIVQALWLGLFAGFTFGLYVLLTNISYRQHCHPIPVGLIQFVTIAVLSSVILLARPITPVSISWPGFALWGLLVGVFMLLVYLLNYISLRLIGARTAIVAAAVPVATLLLSWSFAPQPPLAIIQWTGIILVAMGGAALGQDKLTMAAAKSAKK